MKKSIFFVCSIFLLAGCWAKNEQEKTSPSLPFVAPTEKDVIVPSSQFDPNGVVCAQNYSPVCAQIKVRCATEPCASVWQDFPNKCEAEKLKPVEITEGICPPEKGGMIAPEGNVGQ